MMHVSLFAIFFYLRNEYIAASMEFHQTRGVKAVESVRVGRHGGDFICHNLTMTPTPIFKALCQSDSKAS